MSYLELEETRSRLTALNLEIPNDLEELLNSVAITIDNWLDRTLIPTIYTDRITASSTGQLFLHYSPVITIVSVKEMVLKPIDNSQSAIAAKRANPFTAGQQDLTDVTATAYWDGEHIIYTGSRGRFIVEYWAGLEPMPIVVKNTAFALLRKGMELGSFEALYEPTKDITSLSIPGGLSQSFQHGGGRSGGGGGKGGGTVLDRLLTSIEQYRRKIIVVD